MSAMLEKHRIIAEFYPSYFKKEQERIQKSIKSPEELVPTLRLYGQEILQFDDSYPDCGIHSLSCLLRNKGDFFTKKNSQKAIEGVTKLLFEACKSTYGIDSLAKIRDKFVIYTLSGRDSKMLKQSHQLYTA